MGLYAGPAAARAFGRFAGVLGRSLGDRVVGSGAPFKCERVLGQGAGDRRLGPESGRMVRSDADQGDGPGWRMGPENHRGGIAAEWRLGAWRRAADAASQPEALFDAPMKTTRTQG